jgi:hypothetical protein
MTGMEEKLWRAIMNQSGHWFGTFLFRLRTTGIADRGDVGAIG